MKKKIRKEKERKKLPIFQSLVIELAHKAIWKKNQRERDTIFLTSGLLIQQCHFYGHVKNH
jgi:hypothetical protein